jgi:hypothetical protein
MSEIDQASCSVQSTTDKNVFIRSKQMKTSSARATQRTKKRTQRILLRPIDPPVLNQTPLTSDIWEIDSLNMQFNNLFNMVNKQKDITARTNAPTTFGLRKSFHQWRGGRLKEQFYSEMEELQATINTSEESIRLWLSAIVMQKWTSRREAMTYINDLDASIALHEFRLDSMDARLQELKDMLRDISDCVRQFASILMFNEVNYSR